MALYDFSHKYRGLAVIIVNKKFCSKKFNDDRLGSDRDMVMMKDLFKQLGFLVEPHEDLKQKEMIDVLEKASKWGNHKDSDCFVCVVSSHGKEEMEKKPVTPGAMTWKNSIAASDGEDILVEDIMQKFNDKNCPDLSGKPKMFFIQACRIRMPTDGKSGYDWGIETSPITLPGGNGGAGDSDNKGDSGDGTDIVDENADTGESGNNTQSITSGDSAAHGDTSEGGQKESSQETDTVREIEGADTTDPGVSGDTGIMPNVPYDVVPVNCPKDCLIMFPVGTGKFALRNGANGSYLLQYLYDSPRKQALVEDGMNLLQYLTMVCNRMANYEFNPVPYYRKLYPLWSEEMIKNKVMKAARLTEEEYLNLPFKMTAHIFHRLRGMIQFTDTSMKATA